jgi:flagellar export protein FliJ
MKRFHFNLAAVQTVRRQHENAALENYATALRSRATAARNLDQADQILAQSWSALENLLAHPFPAGEARRTQQECDLLAQQRKAALTALANADTELQNALARFLHARRNREAVDRLEHRQHQTYQRDFARHEMKILDELALRRSAVDLNSRVGN